MIMMSFSKPSPPAPKFLLLILSIYTAFFKSSHCIENHNSKISILCPETEKQALLSFKQYLEDPSNQLSSWNNGSEVNCCKWKGVICDNFTGHVRQLHLRNYSLQSGKSINPSLLNLKQLRYLDLSQNFLHGTTIPSFIGMFRKLEYLNLSNSRFYGTIPHTIGNLSNLHTLSLGEEYGSLDVDNLQWLSRLSQLEHLDMEGVNLSAATNWVQVINTLPVLVELHFQYCYLDFIVNSLRDGVNVSSSLAILDISSNYGYLSEPTVVPKWFFQLKNLIFLDLSANFFNGAVPNVSNTTKLQHIDLSFNIFNSTIPDWLYSCKNLQYLSLGPNSLHGTISDAVANLSSLNILDLSGNEFSGKIPREIANLCKIQSLDLSFNKLQGELSESFGNMSDCFLDSLQSLDLFDNQISGHLTDQFGKFKSLGYLSLRNNLLGNAIPTNIGDLSSLEVLDLSYNKLTGNLPKSLGQLFNLSLLSFENNMLEGVVTESHFSNLTKLIYLFASRNHQLTLKVNPNWIPPFKLQILQLASWDLSTKNIPSWIKTQKNLVELDLSYTGISGLVPNWVWDISYLNLSHNQLHGKVPDIIRPYFIILSSNQFNGPLPQIAASVIFLDLSDNSFSGDISNFLCKSITNKTDFYALEILLLRGNQLVGELPDCFVKWPSLKVLNLGNNFLSGNIPNSMGFLNHMWSLNLNSNKLSGHIPFRMHNCTNLLKIDLAHNLLEGNIPTWMSASLPRLRILVLRSNNLSGNISSNICQLDSLHILDLSDNKLSGMIPRCVNNFTEMTAKRNMEDYGMYGSVVGIKDSFIESATISTKGGELEYGTILALVTSIDLSNNNLSGDIPEEMTSLVELRSLNLSGNHLTGLIPNNIGDMKELESLDLSRNSLSGGIPNSFTTMSYLNHLNLSYNKLSGKIPESTQILGLDASSFIGNQLCGLPLTRNCSNSKEVPALGKDHEGEKSKIDWFYVFLSSGFTVGFSAICTALMFNKSWRDAYFGFMEDMWNKIYVFICIKWRRLARR